MKSLSKILGIGLLTLVSLASCTRLYEFKKGERIYYNDGELSPLVIENDTAKIVYEGEPKNAFSLRATGKDINTIKVAKARKRFLTGENTGQYKPFYKLYSIKNPKDSAFVNMERKKFDRYLLQIDSADNARREQNREVH